MFHQEQADCLAASSVRAEVPMRLVTLVEVSAVHDHHGFDLAGFIRRQQLRFQIRSLLC